MKIIILSILSFFIFGCSSLIYYPDQVEYYKKSELPYNIEEHEFPDTLGHQIHAWYLHAKSPKAKILFFHGNAQNLTSHVAMLSWLVDLNYDLMIFDYPGYGKSTGTPNPENTAMAGLKALEKIETIKPELPLFIYGQSLGGQVAQKSLNLYEKKNYKAVFIEASFPSYKSVAVSKMSKHWLTWILQPVAWLIMSDSWAGDVSKIAPVPVHILHGNWDQVIPFDQGEALFNKADEPKYWKVIEGGYHSNTYSIRHGEYRKYLLETLESHL